MARPKKSETEEVFDLDKALELVNPYLREGFLWFIKDKTVNNQKSFDKELKIYGGFR